MRNNSGDKGEVAQVSRGKSLSDGVVLDLMYTAMKLNYWLDSLLKDRYIPKCFMAG